MDHRQIQGVLVHAMCRNGPTTLSEQNLGHSEREEEEEEEPELCLH